MKNCEVTLKGKFINVISTNGNNNKKKIDAQIMVKTTEGAISVVPVRLSGEGDVLTFAKLKEDSDIAMKVRASAFKEDIYFSFAGFEEKEATFGEKAKQATA